MKVEMDVLIIGCFDLHMHPYASKYINFLRNNGDSVSMVYWNRSGIEPPEKDIYIPFNQRMDTYNIKWAKIFAYIKYYRFVMKHLKNKKYDRYIFLTTQAMVLFSRFAKSIKGKYIFDYRDETYEKNHFYKKKVEKCICDSYFTVISSPGFINIFPTVNKNKFVLSHNCKDWIKDISIQKKDSDLIRLSFWGQVRQIEYFKKPFMIFGNDPRFLIKVYGEGFSKEMDEFIKKNKLTNISVFGKYSPKDIIRFAEETDVLINCYSNKSIQKWALTVKMYEGIFLNIPMMVQDNSFMAHYLEDNKISFLKVDFDSSAPIDKNAFIQKVKSICNDTTLIRNKIEKDEKNFYSSLNCFVR